MLIKRTFFFMVLFFCAIARIYADCPQAAPTSSSEFCSTFQTAARCHCTASHLPSAMCNDTRLLFQRLIVTFGSIEKTCAFQRDTTTQNCTDSWFCYMRGGRNFNGQLCNGNGRPCV